MNYRDYKIFGAGEYFHVYNRGNSKEPIFLDREDYKFFIFRLKQNLFPDKKLNPREILLPENSFSLVSYCLMPNHFHLLIRQNSDLPTSKLLLKLCTSYSKFFNKKYSKIGHLFQDRFKQVWINNNYYLKWLSVYIHQNPKVAGLVDDPALFEWSSYQEYLNLVNKNICDKKVILDQFSNIDDYKKFVSESYEVIKTKSEIKEVAMDFD